MHGIIYPPDDPRDYPEWRAQLDQWRRTTRYQMGYDGSPYAQPEFGWISRAFALGLLMMSDRRFYNPVSGRYTLDTLLDAAVQDFGGYDAVIFWHAYPKIGFDDRNQFDFYRDTLGGRTICG